MRLEPALSLLLLFLALAQLRRLGLEVLQLLAVEHLLTLVGCKITARLVPPLLKRLDGLEQPRGLTGLLLLGFPGPSGVNLLLLLSELAQAVDACLVAPDLPLQLRQVVLQGAAGLLRIAQFTGRPAGTRQQAGALPLHLLDQRVAAAAGHFTQSLAETAGQRRLQVLAGMPHGIAHLLARPLLDPQQAGNPPVLGLAGSPPRELKAQELGQTLLGLIAIKRFARGHQIAALALEKALVQPPLLPLPGERQADLGRRRGVPPGLQLGQAGGAVALEEGGANGAHQRTLAGLVRAGKQIDALVEPLDLERLTKLLKLVEANMRKLHPWGSSRWSGLRALSIPARIPSASRATSRSLSTSCRRCSSAITLPR